MRHILIALLFAASASAQTMEQTAQIRIDEQPMSARTAAMGGASDALASDGSELAANPALIASLKRPVFAISGVESTFDNVRFFFTGESVVQLHEPQSQRAFAHASAAIPWRGAVFGVYARNEPAIGHLAPGGPEGAGEYVPLCTGDDCQYSIVVGQSAWERRERRYGLTAAFERGALSFGAGAELQELDEAYDVTRGSGDDPFSRAFERVTRRTSGSKVVPNAGVRWRVGPRMALAAAYNGAASHEQTEDVCSTSIFSLFGCSSRISRLGTNTVRGADAWRASVAMAPIDRLVVTAEVVRWGYGKFNSQKELAFIGNAEYRDATDIHAGAEYRLPWLPVSLRAGWLRQPAKFEGITYFGQREETLDHATYGAGLEVAGARIDVAYDDAKSPAFRRAIVGVTFGLR
jgi:hypothetical protein